MDDGPLTITVAAELIRAGKLSPVELLDICLKRIDRYEPRVKAWVHIDRDRAKRDAEQLTAELKTGQNRGPLHGIPIGVKDIIDVFDMPTGCGSKLWANSYARRDATVVERLRQAGALILGKTVTTAYAYLDPPPTRNPWNLDRTPGGSSSGSAAAVACGMCLGALATQTGGSTTRPASYCGVCSFKPSYGRVSVDGILPLAPSLDHVGVMANCVRDLATLYQCVAGWDGRDRYCRQGVVADHFAVPVPIESEPDEGPELVQVETTFNFFRERAHPGVHNALSSYMGRLARDRPTDGKIGRVSAVVLPAGFSAIPEHHFNVMAAEAASVHSERMRRHPEDYPARIGELISRGQASSGRDLAAAYKFKSELGGEFRLHRFGFLLTPATPTPPPTPETTGDPVFNSPWSFLGLPTVSIPIEVLGGLPVAAQFVSKFTRETELLRVAEWCEAVAGFTRRLPPVP